MPLKGASIFGYGTTRTFRNVRYSVAVGCKADIRASRIQDARFMSTRPKLIHPKPTSVLVSFDSMEKCRHLPVDKLPSLQKTALGRRSFSISAKSEVVVPPAAQRITLRYWRPGKSRGTRALERGRQGVLVLVHCISDYIQTRRADLQKLGPTRNAQPSVPTCAVCESARWPRRSRP